MRFLANENFPLNSVKRLRRLDHDIAAIAEDSPGAKDVAVLTRAVEENRIVLTFDRDYGELIFRRKLGAPLGVVYLRFDPYTPEEPAEQLEKLINLPDLVLEGRFTVFDRKNVRQRPLK